MNSKTTAELFGENLRNQLVVKNKSQADIARHLKVTEASVSRWVNGLISCPVCGKNMSGCCYGYGKYYRCKDHGLGICNYTHQINENKLEQWLLDNIEEDFRVQVTMKPKQKTEDPKKYKEQLKRLNDIYLLGNMTQAEYKARSAEIQQKLAEIAKTPALKTQNFSSNWKDLYQELDEKHRRLFWRNIIRGIAVSVENTDFRILY